MPTCAQARVPATPLSSSSSSSSGPWGLTLRLSLHYPKWPPWIPLLHCCYYLFMDGALSLWMGTYLDVPDSEVRSPTQDVLITSRAGGEPASPETADHVADAESLSARPCSRGGICRLGFGAGRAAENMGVGSAWRGPSPRSHISLECCLGLTPVQVITTPSTGQGLYCCTYPLI